MAEATPERFVEAEGYVNVEARSDRTGAIRLVLSGVTQKPGGGRDVVSSVHVTVRIPRRLFEARRVEALVVIPVEAVQWDPIVEIALVGDEVG